jgi:hypothetical protein
VNKREAGGQRFPVREAIAPRAAKEGAKSLTPNGGHLRHLLEAYQKYYNEARTHLSLEKDAPIPRAIQAVGQTLAVPVLGGLHHQYVRT